MTAVAAAIAILFIAVLMTAPPRHGAEVAPFALEIALCTAAAFSGRWPLLAGCVAMAFQGALLLFPGTDSTFATLAGLLPVASCSALGRWRSGASLTLAYLTLSCIAETRAVPPQSLRRVVFATFGWAFILSLTWLTTFGFHQLQRALKYKYASQRQQQQQIIARQLHDTALQSLSRISLIAASADASAQPDPNIRGSLEKVGDLARATADDLNEILIALRDPDPDLDSAFLKHSPLQEVLDSAAESLRGDGFQPVVVGSATGLALSPACHGCLVAGIREAARNIAKHGAPGICTLRLTVNAERRSVTFTAANQLATGRQESRVGGHGLIGMRERVAILNGRFSSMRSTSDPTTWLTSLSLPIGGDSHDSSDHRSHRR